MAQTAHVKSATLNEVQGECTDTGGTITSWHFIINQLGNKNPIAAPSSISVSWDLNGDGHADDTQSVALTQSSGPVAHYETSLHPGGIVVDATANIANNWSGQFNLSHVECHAAPAAPTTVTITKQCAGLEHVAVQFSVGDQLSALNQDCGAVYHVEVTGTSVNVNEHLRGTAIASISCNGSDYVALAPEGYTLQLVQNHDNPCTIINHAPAPTTVTVTKQCAGLEHVAVQFQVGEHFSALNQDCGAVYHLEVTGTSVVVNEHLRGTAIASISCNGSEYVALASEGYTLQLVQNHDNPCTIINHAPAEPPTVVAKCNSGRGNNSESTPQTDCDPGNSGANNQGGD